MSKVDSYPSAVQRKPQERNVAVGGSARDRNLKGSEWTKRVQWQVPGGWYLRQPQRLAGRVPMAIYFNGQTPIAFQYFQTRKTPGVEVLP